MLLTLKECTRTLYCVNSLYSLLYKAGKTQWYLEIMMEEIILLHVRHRVFSIDLALVQNTINHMHFDSTPEMHSCFSLQKFWHTSCFPVVSLIAKPISYSSFHAVAWKITFGKGLENFSLEGKLLWLCIVLEWEYFGNLSESHCFYWSIISHTWKTKFSLKCRRNEIDEITNT